MQESLEALRTHLDNLFENKSIDTTDYKALKHLMFMIRDEWNDENEIITNHAQSIKNILNLNK